MAAESIKTRFGRRAITVVTLLIFLPVLQGFHAHPVTGWNDSTSLIEQPVDLATFSTECLFCAVGSLKFCGPESGSRVDFVWAADGPSTGLFQSLAFAYPTRTGGPRSPPRLI